MGITTGSSVGRAHLNHFYTYDEEGVSTDNIPSVKSLHKRCGSRGNRGNRSGSDSDETLTPRGRPKKKNGGKALIDDELMTCLLDNGSQLNFITPAYAHKRGMDIMSLGSLTQEVGGKPLPVLGIGGIMVNPEGFIMMNVKVPCVKGYNEDQTAIVMDDLGMEDCSVILGMPTISRVMEVIKESEISKLAIPWASSRVSWLMRGVHA